MRWRGIRLLTKLHNKNKRRKSRIQATNGVEERTTLILCLHIFEHILAQGGGVCICSMQNDEEEVACYTEVDQKVDVQPDGVSRYKGHLARNGTDETTKTRSGSPSSVRV